MKDRKPNAVLVALAFVITLMTGVGASAQNAGNARLVPVPQGQKQKIQGVVSVVRAIISQFENLAAPRLPYF